MVFLAGTIQRFGLCYISIAIENVRDVRFVLSVVKASIDAKQLRIWLNAIEICIAPLKKCDLISMCPNGNAYIYLLGNILLIALNVRIYTLFHSPITKLKQRRNIKTGEWGRAQHRKLIHCYSACYMESN